MNGFFGTGATFRADRNLAVQIAMGLALLVGMMLGRRRHFGEHKYCQSSEMHPYYCEFHGDKHVKEMPGVVTVK